MKKIILLTLVIASFGNFAYSQEEREKSESKAIEFSSRQGSLIKKVFYPMGKVKGVDFEVLLMVDEINKDRIACLRLKTYNVTTKDDYIGTLDADEIDACIKSLKYISDVLFPTTPEQYTECEYKSKDGVRLGAFKGAKGWSAFVYTKSYTSRSAEFLKAEDFPGIISKLEESKNKIAEVLKSGM